MSERFSLLKPGDCPEDEELCVATLADKDDVIAIAPDAYDGFDYLPSTYEKFVSGPGVTGYLYKKQGEVVAFFSVQLVDDGETITASAGRLSQKWRGAGMFGRFTRRVFQRSVDLNPRLRYTTMDTHDQNWEINGHKIQKSYEIIEEKHIRFLLVDAAKTRESATKKASEIPGVRHLSREELRKLLRENPADLFPNGRVMFDLKSFRVMPENLDLILADRDSCLGSFSTEKSTQNSDQNESTATPCLVSIATFFFCKRGVSYQVTFFGSGSDDMMRAHFEWHVLRLAEIAGDCDAFMLTLSPKDTTHTIDSLKKDYPIEKTEVSWTKAFLLQMEFKR